MVNCKLRPIYPRKRVVLLINRRPGGIQRLPVWASEKRSEPQTYSFQSSKAFDQSLCICCCGVCTDFTCLSTESIVQRSPTGGFLCMCRVQCYLATSKITLPRPHLGCHVLGKKVTIQGQAFLKSAVKFNDQ